MKPFDLQAALDGDLVMLRNGETAKVVAYSPDAQNSSQLIGWGVGGDSLSWTVGGNFVGKQESFADIVGMATKKRSRTGWVNVYFGSTGDELYKSIDDANKANQFVSCQRIACVQVTYEWEE